VRQALYQNGNAVQHQSQNVNEPIDGSHGMVQQRENLAYLFYYIKGLVVRTPIYPDSLGRTWHKCEQGE
jgi:hypothetical protein